MLRYGSLLDDGRLPFPILVGGFRPFPGRVIYRLPLFRWAISIRTYDGRKTQVYPYAYTPYLVMIYLTVLAPNTTSTGGANVVRT